MSRPLGDDDRRKRVRRLRDSWRDDAPSPAPAGDPGATDVTRQRRSDALGSNDRIRAEAPDDAETRRRADQFEREVKRSPRPGG